MAAALQGFQMQIIDQGTVVASQPGTDRSSCCFPSVCALPTPGSAGRWLVGYRAAPKKADTRGICLLTWSDDQGKTWREPVEPFPDVPVIDGKEGDFRALGLTPLGGQRVLATLYWVDQSDPSRPFFNEQTEGLLDSLIFFAVSGDGGATWSQPRQVDTRRYMSQPTPITGPILALPDGNWAAQFELNKTYEDPRPWRHAPCMVFSQDEGKTWGGEIEVATHAENAVFYWDQRPSVLADGTLLDVFWTYDLKAQTYLNIHACRSTDAGRTWSDLWDTGLPGQPAPPRSLPDGRIAMPYVDRTAAPCIKLRVSADGGRTWPDDSELLLHEPTVGGQIVKKSTMQDAWSEMGKYSVGLPHSAGLPDGGVLVAYYTGPAMDQTDIQWVRAGAIGD